MKDKIAEQLSAMFDDELDEHEYELLMRRLEQDGDLKNAWTRYQMIGAAMRNDNSAVAPGDLLGKISQRVQQEPALNIQQDGGSKSFSLFKPMAGLAVAASVAVMAVIGVQNIGYQDDQTPVLTSSLVGDPVRTLDQAQPSLVPVAGTRWSSDQPVAEMRLNGYLVNHSEYSSGISLQGMINYARIAGYDSRKQGKRNP